MLETLSETPVQGEDLAAELNQAMGRALAALVHLEEVLGQPSEPTAAPPEHTYFPFDRAASTSLPHRRHINAGEESAVFRQRLNGVVHERGRGLDGRILTPER